MHLVNVVTLDQFVREALLAGFDNAAIAGIEDSIMTGPYFGHRLIPLELKCEGFPLSGFYTRSWKARGSTGVLIEGCSLHLYFNDDYPAYLFNMSSCFDYATPWQEPTARGLLAATAHAMFEELAKVRS